MHRLIQIEQPRRLCRVLCSYTPDMTRSRVTHDKTEISIANKACKVSWRCNGDRNNQHKGESYASQRDILFASEKEKKKKAIEKY